MRALEPNQSGARRGNLDPKNQFICCKAARTTLCVYIRALNILSACKRVNARVPQMCSTSRTAGSTISVPADEIHTTRERRMRTDERTGIAESRQTYNETHPSSEHTYRCRVVGSRCVHKSIHLSKTRLQFGWVSIEIRPRSRAVPPRISRDRDTRIRKNDDRIAFGGDRVSILFISNIRL